MVNSILFLDRVYLRPVLSPYFFMDVRLNSTCLSMLEKFQCEIGRRMLKLSRHHSALSVRIGLHWPAVSTRILCRKLNFLCKLLTSSRDSMSHRLFTTLAMDDIYSISLVQQCRMLEAPLQTDIVDQCLSDPANAKSIFRSSKKLLLKQDYHQLLSSALSHSSSKFIAEIALGTSWWKIWDNVLDYGIKGTICGQAILRELSRPTFGNKACHICNDTILNHSFPSHLCSRHPSLMCNESLTTIIAKVSSLDSHFILLLGSRLNSSVS